MLDLCGGNVGRVRPGPVLKGAPQPGEGSPGWGPQCRGEGSTGWLECPAPLDLNSTSQIIFLSCMMKSKMRQALGFSCEARESPDTQALLTCAENEEDNQEARNEALSHRLENCWVPTTFVLGGGSGRRLTTARPGILGSFQAWPAGHFKKRFMPNTECHNK